MNETLLAKERALIIGVNVNQDPYFLESIEELKNLAIACNIEPIAEITQNLPRPNVAHYVGSGKIEEIRQLADSEEIDVLIFEDELTPSQIRNLAKLLDIEVIDRTRLILDIFAHRAKTKEAKMQVEIARLRYALPRLRNSNQNFGHQRGGAVKNRGAGETKLELKRRKVEEKITELEAELKNIALTRVTQRKKRVISGAPRVALVGYTNAGKSTLMNAMVRLSGSDEEKLVYEENMLFATLDTSVRSIKFENSKTILLSDTVGFINKLPHHLVKAFHSTLEEVREADLLLHVIDKSNPHHELQLEVTNDTLKLINADDIPQILIYNKCDLLEDMNEEMGDNVALISAKKQLGFKELVLKISQSVFAHEQVYKLLIPFDAGQIISNLKSSGSILAMDYEERGTILTVSLNEATYGSLKKYEL